MKEVFTTSPEQLYAGASSKLAFTSTGKKLGGAADATEPGFSESKMQGT